MRTLLCGAGCIRGGGVGGEKGGGDSAAQEEALAVLQGAGKDFKNGVSGDKQSLKSLSQGRHQETEGTRGQGHQQAQLPGLPLTSWSQWCPQN